MPVDVLPAGEGPSKKKLKAEVPLFSAPKNESNAEIWKSNVWKKVDGSVEPVIELDDEPHHHVSFVNDYTKIITIKMEPHDTTLAHRHAKDTIIFICMENGVDFINDVMGCLPQMGHMEFGQVGFGPYTTNPCVHKITNITPTPFFVVNVEVLRKPPITQNEVLKVDCHTLVKEQPNCRVYKLSLKPGESTDVTYGFFYVQVVLRGSEIKTMLMEDDSLSWTESFKMGDSEWKEPRLKHTIKNVGKSVYEAYICEFV